MRHLMVLKLMLHVSVKYMQVHCMVFIKWHLKEIVSIYLKLQHTFAGIEFSVLERDDLDKY